VREKERRGREGRREGDRENEERKGGRDLRG